MDNTLLHCAAERNFNRANLCLGQLYMFGSDGVAVNPEKSYYHYSMAAMNASADALATLSRMYMLDHQRYFDCEPHAFRDESDRLLQQAADLGCLDAVFSINKVSREASQL